MSFVISMLLLYRRINVFSSNINCWYMHECFSFRCFFYEVTNRYTYMKPILFFSLDLSLFYMITKHWMITWCFFFCFLIKMLIIKKIHQAYSFLVSFRIIKQPLSSQGIPHWMHTSKNALFPTNHMTDYCLFFVVFEASLRVVGVSDPKSHALCPLITHDSCWERIRMSDSTMQG